MNYLWEKPKLVTLYRGSPDEIATPSINCKHLAMEPTLQDSTNVNCNTLDPTNATSGCGLCQNNANRS